MRPMRNLAACTFLFWHAGHAGRALRAGSGGQGLGAGYWVRFAVERHKCNGPDFFDFVLHLLQCWGAPSAQPRQDH